MRLLGLRSVDAVRAALAGAGAVRLRLAGTALFEVGGWRVLPPVVQRAARSAVEREASRVLAAFGVAERALEGGAVRTLAVRGARAAGRQVAVGVAAAAGSGALVDGGWALVQAVRRVRKGSMTRAEAAAHVAREAGTGAAATAAGTAAAALLVTLTGGVAAPALFVTAAAASLGAKAGLDAWLARRRQPLGGLEAPALAP